MARNKYPEETVEKILDVSTRLFMENGYDQTSIQDIIDQLGGLSKGAIYHHFKSKADILLAIVDRVSAGKAEEMQAIVADATLTGAAKLRQMFLSSFKDSTQRELIASMPNLVKNPQLLSLHLSNTIEDVVPHYILPVIQEGIDDGSIQCDYPQEMADVLMLLTNVWLNPLIYPATQEGIRRKIALFNQILASLGFPTLEAGLDEHIQLVGEKMSRLQNKDVLDTLEVHLL
ncbi:MAG: TetR/AcrR family transcriptional regulator [Gemmiger sp.]|nr:TetR/AcrR family transcriptional regulator [Gemmiger sp.]